MKREGPGLPLPPPTTCPTLALPLCVCPDPGWFLVVHHLPPMAPARAVVSPRCPGASVLVEWLVLGSPRAARPVADGFGKGTDLQVPRLVPALSCCEPW